MAYRERKKDRCFGSFSSFFRLDERNRGSAHTASGGEWIDDANTH
jgi:hypothetical protein